MPRPESYASALLDRAHATIHYVDMKIGNTEIQGPVVYGAGVLIVIVILFLLGVTNVVPALNFYGTGDIVQDENESSDIDTSAETGNGSTNEVGEGLLGELAVGVEADASARVTAQPAGMSVAVTEVQLPQDGWVVVHEVLSGHVANALGAARREAGVHETVTVNLLRGTVAGGEYVVVLYADNGNGEFELRADQPIVNPDGDPIIVSFMAQ